MPFRSWTSELRTVPFSAFAKASRAVRNRNASNGVWVLFLSSLSLSLSLSLSRARARGLLPSTATFSARASLSRAGSSYENAGKPGNVGSRGFLSMLESTKSRNELSRVPPMTSIASWETVRSRAGSSQGNLAEDRRNRSLSRVPSAAASPPIPNPARFLSLAMI